MNLLSHLSYPVLIFVFLARLFHFDYSFFDLLLLLFFSILPDFDLVFFSLFKQKNHHFSFFDLIKLTLFSILPNLNFLTGQLAEKLHRPSQHHQWLSHQPFTYLPFVIFLFFYPNPKLFLACFGLYSHFILDTLFGGRIMWLYPFSSKFFGLFSEKFKNYSGLDYFRAYKKSLIYKIDILAFFTLLIILISLWF